MATYIKLYRVLEGEVIMRTCFDCNGDKMIEDPYQVDGIFYCEEDLISGVVEPCYTCEGTGEVDDVCYCSAFCSCECCCGAWDGEPCHCRDYD